MSVQAKLSLGTKVIKGTFWAIGMRWVSRFMGLASMALVARQLKPEDFGIVAVSIAIIGLMDSFTNLGADTALIRHTNPQPKHYNTVWTFTVMMHLFSAWLIAIVGYFSIYLYHDMRYEGVLYAMSLSMIFNGLANVGVVDFRRKLDYHKDFQINVGIQMAGVLSTIGLSFLLHSYWALVLGGTIRSLVKVALSYSMSSYRPRISLAAHKEMFSFSFWMMISSISSFLSSKFDRLILARYFSPTILGLYAIAGEIASMVVFELLLPIERALLPALAARQQDKKWLEGNIIRVFNISATMAIATGIGLALVAKQVLIIIYGARYVDAANIMVAMAILNAIYGLNQSSNQFLLLMDKAKILSLFFMLEAVLTIAMVAGLSVCNFDFQTILYGRFFVAILGFFRLFYLIKLCKEITLIKILLAWVRPICAAVAMSYSVDSFKKIFHHDSPVVELLSFIVIGGGVYSIVLLLMWFVMKKPQGIEYEILHRINKNIVKI